MVNINQNLWMPTHKMDHIFFDVDSTLSAIEGIDVLANWNQVGHEVSAITEQCMSETGMNPESYQRRLEMVRPTLTQISQLSDLYIKKLTIGAQEVISLLQYLGKQVYIVSAGIKQALLPLADHLSIQPENIFAVDVFFDEQGKYHHFDYHSPLAQKDGKTLIIKKTCPSKVSACLIGDGLSDLETKSAVNRFVGFGGYHIRKAVQDASSFYITASHLFALLPLILTQSEVEQLGQNQYQQYAIGISAVDSKDVLFKELGNV